MRSILSASAFLFITAVQAQTPLPYTTGFDNATQQQGWQLLQAGFESPYEWAFTANDAHSAPNKLWHDYNVGGSQDQVVMDWAVSPPFDLSGGATVEAQVNVYAITGSAMPDDRFKVMLLVGSPDPALATDIEELADLMDMVTTGDAWEAMPAVTVPPTPGTSYIAFYYQTSINWFTPGVDDVSITSTGTGIHEPSAATDIRLYPNPVVETLTVDAHDAHAGEPLRLTLFDARGALIVDHTFTGRSTVRVSFPNGRYAYAIRDRQGAVVKRGDLVLGR